MGLSIKFDKEGFLNFFDCNTSSFADIKANAMWAMGLLKMAHNSSIENWTERYTHLEFYSKDEDYTYFRADSISLLRFIVGAILFLPCVVIMDIFYVVGSVLLLPFVVLYNLKITVK